jgi:hypothetical protein
MEPEGPVQFSTLTLPSPRRALALRLAALALLCALAYAPSLRLPLLEDDYPNLWLSLRYGPPQAAPAILSDGFLRTRATSHWSMYALWRIFGMNAWGYRAASLCLHIADAWLLYFLGLAWPRMRPAAIWAAGFFAIHEGHQEAVMWFSAINEPLMFLFGAGAMLCHLAASGARRGWPLETAGALLFTLALLSKESAVIFLPLLWLAAPERKGRRAWAGLWPYAALVVVDLALIASTRASSPRFTDGSFAMNAPVWSTLARNLARLLWIWGWLAGIAVLVARDGRLTRGALLALAWMALALVPYSFLTYSPQIPSRQFYLASAGLSLLVGLALDWLWAHRAGRRGWVAAALVALVIHNVGILWFRKYAQFEKRAEPTEQLIALARRTPGPIWVQCFPTNPLVAEGALFIALGRPFSDLVWSREEAAQRGASATFCYPRP